MSQYKDLVAKQKARINAEKWSQTIKELEARDGYLQKTYNSGYIIREYQDGSSEVIVESDPIETIIDNFMETE